MADSITTGDLALMRGNDGLGGGNAFIWIFALLLLLFGMNGFGGRGAVDAASQGQVATGFQNQQLQQIALSSANNNYETARLIDAQTAAMTAQNNTNLVNAIQGYNQINLSIQNQTNVLSGQLQALQAKMDSCCCEIKTQMLQTQLAEEQRKNAEKTAEISNYQQSQYLLSNLGRFVAWAGSGAPAATASGN